MTRKESNRKTYLKRKLVNAGYDVVGLSIFELEELDKEYKRETVMLRRRDRIEKKDQPIGTIEGDKSRNVDNEFYTAIEEMKETPERKKIKIPDGVSSLLYDRGVHKRVDFEGEEIKPEKDKKQKPIWRF